MNLYMPPHKHVGDKDKPGQIVNHDMMDDMGRFADTQSAVHPMTPCENLACACTDKERNFWKAATFQMRYGRQSGNTETAPLAAAYKPVHGGYPDVRTRYGYGWDEGY